MEGLLIVLLVCFDHNRSPYNPTHALFRIHLKSTDETRQQAARPRAKGD